jgi:hypothetical protein
VTIRRRWPRVDLSKTCWGRSGGVCWGPAGGVRLARGWTRRRLQQSPDLPLGPWPWLNLQSSRPPGALTPRIFPATPYPGRAMMLGPHPGYRRSHRRYPEIVSARYRFAGWACAAVTEPSPGTVGEFSRAEEMKAFHQGLGHLSGIPSYVSPRAHMARSISILCSSTACLRMFPI